MYCIGNLFYTHIMEMLVEVRTNPYRKCPPFTAPRRLNHEVQVESFESKSIAVSKDPTRLDFKVSVDGVNI